MKELGGEDLLGTWRVNQLHKFGDETWRGDFLGFEDSCLVYVGILDCID